MFKILSLLSLLSGSQSRLNTVQVLCPIMTKEQRETLVALAISGIINWCETDREDTDKQTIRQNSRLLCWTTGSVCAVCHRCVRVSGSSAVLSKGQYTGAE